MLYALLLARTDCSVASLFRHSFCGFDGWNSMILIDIYCIHKMSRAAFEKLYYWDFANNSFYFSYIRERWTSSSWYIAMHLLHSNIVLYEWILLIKFQTLEYWWTMNTSSFTDINFFLQKNVSTIFIFQQPTHFRHKSDLVAVIKSNRITKHLLTIHCPSIRLLQSETKLIANSTTRHVKSAKC